MYEQVEAWIDQLALDNIPDDVAAFCFNLYDGWDNTNWSMELIGADSFDAEDSDWACAEVTDFNSRNTEFKWVFEGNWEAALAIMSATLKNYLENGKFAAALKEKAAVAVGFVDGDLDLLFTK